MVVLFPVISLAQTQVNENINNNYDIVKLSSDTDSSLEQVNNNEEFLEELKLMQELTKESNSNSDGIGTKTYETKDKNGNIISLTVTNKPKTLAKGWEFDNTWIDIEDIGIGYWEKTMYWTGPKIGKINLTCEYEVYRGAFNNTNSVRATGVREFYTSPSGATTTSSSSYSNDSTGLSAIFKGFFFNKTAFSSNDFYMKVEISGNGLKQVKTCSDLYMWK